MEKRPRKIVKRDITEDQFMAVLRQVCQPLKKPIQSEPQQLEKTKQIGHSGGKNGVV